MDVIQEQGKVGRAVGEGEQCHFSRVFQRDAGLAPRNFRNPWAG
jgi:transcriptional regulator GlxA family with amidase domain